MLELISDKKVKYFPIDTHIKEVLTRTGLFGYMYISQISIGIEYENFRELCIYICEVADKTPLEIDKTLWYFGSKICKNPPDCDNCRLGTCIKFKKSHKTMCY